MINSCQALEERLEKRHSFIRKYAVANHAELELAKLKICRIELICMTNEAKIGDNYYAEEAFENKEKRDHFAVYLLIS